MAGARTGATDPARARARRGERGFTLTEMLVALAVFSMLAVGTSQVLASVSARFVELRQQAQDRQAGLQVQAALNRLVVSAGAQELQAEPPSASSFQTRCEAQADRAQPSNRSAHIELRDGPMMVTFDTARSCTRIASASTIVNAPRDCVYDAVGRRCLEGGQP